MAVMRGEGGVLGLYKGTVSTLLREVPGNAAMFGAYEVVKQWMVRQQVCPGHLEPTAHACFQDNLWQWRKQNNHILGCQHGYGMMSCLHADSLAAGAALGLSVQCN